MPTLRPSRWSSVLALLLGALAAGWVAGFVLLEWAQHPPVPPWPVPAGLVVLAATVAVLAGNLRRRLSAEAATRAQARPVSPLSGVRYVAGAKACIHGGAVLVGFYLGLTVALMLHVSEPQWPMVAACLASAAASAVVVAAGWLLERTCRIKPPDDPQPLPSA